jgi:hypothetical protein
MNTPYAYAIPKYVYPFLIVSHIQSRRISESKRKVETKTQRKETVRDSSLMLDIDYTILSCFPFSFQTITFLSRTQCLNQLDQIQSFSLPHRLGEPVNFYTSRQLSTVNIRVLFHSRSEAELTLWTLALRPKHSQYQQLSSEIIRANFIRTRDPTNQPVYRQSLRTMEPERPRSGAGCGLCHHMIYPSHPDACPSFDGKIPVRPDIRSGNSTWNCGDSTELDDVHFESHRTWSQVIRAGMYHSPHVRSKLG